jgi:hypothetical protein
VQDAGRQLNPAPANAARPGVRVEADPSYKLIETSVRKVPAKSKLRAFDPRIPELEPVWHTLGYLASSDIIIATCGPLDLLWRPPTTERVAIGVEAL